MSGDEPFSEGGGAVICKIKPLVCNHQLLVVALCYYNL